MGYNSTCAALYKLYQKKLKKSVRYFEKLFWDPKLNKK